MGINREVVSRGMPGGDFAEGASVVLYRMEARSNSPFTFLSGSNACSHRITEGSREAEDSTRAISALSYSWDQSDELRMIKVSPFSVGGVVRLTRTYSTRDVYRN